MSEQLGEQPMDAPEYEALDLLEMGGEADMVGAATSFMQAALPEWEPRAGNTEVVLMEALALMLGVEVLALQMVPSQLLEQLLALYGVSRDPGAGATARVKFTVTASSPIQVIPEGTLLRYEMEETAETFDFYTTTALEIVTSETLEGYATIMAEEIGSELNGLPPGTELELVDTLYFVESVFTDQEMQGGRDEELDDPYYARASSVLARLTSTLVLPEHFRYAATGEPNIGRAKVLDLYDPADPGTEKAGHVTLAVTDLTGQPLTTDAAAALRDKLEQQALASLTIHLISPTYTTVNVALSVTSKPGFSPAQTKAEVEALIRNWINPMTWDWAPEVSTYALVSTLGVASSVGVVTQAPATVPLPGVAPLPRLGTLTVNVI